MPLKIGGRVIDGPKTTILAIPREDNDIIFKFIAIGDDTEFEKISPEPIPPKYYSVKEKKNITNFEDKAYKDKMAIRATQKMNWFFLKSVAPSEVEWDTVKLEDPTTYGNWREDLKNAGFSIGEMNAIFEAFMNTNTVTEEKMTEARNRFLASQQGQPEELVEQ